VFVEEHVEVVKTKGSLDVEDAVLPRLHDLPPYIRNCLDINYLVVISNRRPVRWLLAATGLEALTVRGIGSQPQLSGMIQDASKPTLRSAIEKALSEAGVIEVQRQRRGVDRLLTTTLEPLAAHVRRYLDTVAVVDASVEDIARWWRVRGEVAHGSGAEIDLSDLHRLVNCSPTALRRAAGLEPLP
jgi:hypothetical protein